MELDGFDQAEALIRHWLRAEPAAETSEFLRQAAQALWLEERGAALFTAGLRSRR